MTFKGRLFLLSLPSHNSHSLSSQSSYSLLIHICPSLPFHNSHSLHSLPSSLPVLTSSPFLHQKDRDTGQVISTGHSHPTGNGVRRGYQGRPAGRVERKGTGGERGRDAPRVQSDSAEKVATSRGNCRSQFFFSHALFFSSSSSSSFSSSSTTTLSLLVFPPSYSCSRLLL